MGDRASRRGAVDLGIPLMVVAFVAMIGFLYWLNLQAKAEAAANAAVAEEAAAEESTVDVSAAVLVPGETLQGDLVSQEGSMVRVDGLLVASPLGTQGFWLELPNKNPFLVSFSEALRTAGTQVSAGQTVNVAGIIRAMNTPVLDGWSGAGTITEGDRLAAEFATHYLDALVVEFPSAAPTGGEG